MAKAKKKATCPTVGSRRKFGKDNMTLKKKFKSKRDAKKMAENHRAKGKGKKARVVPSKTCGYQVYTKG